MSAGEFDGMAAILAHDAIPEHKRPVWDEARGQYVFPPPKLECALKVVTPATQTQFERVQADAKRFATLQAVAALSGVMLHRIEGDFSPLIYIASEGCYTRQLDDLDQVARFLEKRTGKSPELLA